MATGFYDWGNTLNNIGNAYQTVLDVAKGKIKAPKSYQPSQSTIQSSYTPSGNFSGYSPGYSGSTSKKNSSGSSSGSGGQGQKTINIHTGEVSYSKGNTSKPSGDWKDSSYWDDRQMMEDMYAAQKEAQEKMVEQAVGAIEAQRPSIYRNAEDDLRQVEIARRLQQRDMPQQLAATGSNGGLAESTILGMNAGFDNQAGNVRRQRSDQLSALDSQIAQTQAQGEIAQAQIEAQQQEALMQREYQRQQQAYERQLAEQQRQDQIDMFLRQLEADKELYSYKLAEQARYSNNRSGSGKPGLTYAQAKSILDDGIDSPAALNAYQYYTGTGYAPSARGIDELLKSPYVEKANSLYDPQSQTSSYLSYLDQYFSPQELEALTNYEAIPGENVWGWAAGNPAPYNAQYSTARLRPDLARR